MKKKINILLITTMLISIFIVLKDYLANQFIYILFSIFSICYLIFMFRKKSIFFDNFIGLFLFLGLWLNFSIKIKLKNIYPNGIGDLKYWFSDGVGSFDFSSDAIDRVLVICIISYTVIIFSSYIREQFFYYKNNLIQKYEKKFYLNNRFKILFIFFTFFTALCFLNFKFQIYQRGSINDYHFLINSFFAFLFLIFFHQLPL